MCRVCEEKVTSIQRKKSWLRCDGRVGVEGTAELLGGILMSLGPEGGPVLKIGREITKLPN